MKLNAAWRSGPLALTSFRLLTAGQLTSNIGDYCYAVALPWLVLSDHGSWPRGPLAALIGAGEGLFIPASFAILPSLLDSEALMAGNAFFGAGQQTGSLPGPAVGGALVAGFGTCLAAGSLLGTLSAARAGGLRRPMAVTGILFVAMSAAVGLVPYLGGLAGAAAAMLVWGLCNGLGNTIDMPALQRAVPARLLGRTKSGLMLCSFGTAPLSVLAAGVLVRHIGPAAFFPVAAALVTAAVLAGLSQREWRNFGARPEAD